MQTPVHSYKCPHFTPHLFLITFLMTCLFPDNNFKHWMCLHASYTTYKMLCSFIKERPQIATLGSLSFQNVLFQRKEKIKLLFYCTLYAYLKRLFSQSRLLFLLDISTSVYKTLQFYSYLYSEGFYRGLCSYCLLFAWFYITFYS